MGGQSKSNSTTKQTVTNETQQADASGVISGNVLQGEVTYTDEFGPGVQEAFSKLVNLAHDAGEMVGGTFEDLIALANKGVEGSERAGSQALEKVSQRYEAQEQPGLSTIRNLIPFALIAVIPIAVYIWRNK